ncbi:MAG: hypothetical protein K2W95_18030 [Candidatus Obscuribacterales bacterium]|nr:hypothetical protein [Candidatus Obscuribacterales bacterium]
MDSTDCMKDFVGLSLNWDALVTSTLDQARQEIEAATRTPSTHIFPPVTEPLQIKRVSFAEFTNYRPVLS